MLAHYVVSPPTPNLTPSQRRSALAIAEAIIPGSARTPAADETTIAHAHEVFAKMHPNAARGWLTLIQILDQGARLRTGKPFHALTHDQQQAQLAAWESHPIVRPILHAVAYTLKIAHFDHPRMYEALGGKLRVLMNVETQRHEQQIHRATSYEGDLDIECDVVVIGSGAGGAVVGEALAARGHAVVFVEEGSYLKRDGFVGSFVHAHTTYFRNTLTAGNSPVMVLQGKLVGGSTAVNTGSCYRTPSFILDEWCERLGTDAFSPANMEPLFDRVEGTLEVSEPERKYIGPIADVFDRGCKALGWKAGPIPRNAVGCEGEGFCDYGCASGARRSVDISYLPSALERGAMLFNELRAERVLIEGGRAVGLEAVDKNGRRFRIRSRAVILAGGAIPTPMFLLKQGIANASGEVGKNLSLHPSGGCGGYFDERLDPDRYIPQGYYCGEFIREGLLINAAQPDANIAHMLFPFTGERLMRAIDSMPHLAIMGVLLRDESRGRVWTDVAGKPVVTYNITPRDLERYKLGLVRAGDILFEAGARRFYTGLIGYDALEGRREFERFRHVSLKANLLALMSYHPLGTCKMGKDPKTNVVGLDHQAHDVPGLYIVDASTVPGPLGVNPQVTIMAMATRAAGLIDAALS